MTPAFRLVAACCRWPANDQRASAIDAAAAAIEDWIEVVRLADRHRVEPLVANGLAAADLAVPPALEAAVRHHRALSLRDIGETLRIAAALDRAGIEHLFLKGAALGVAAYGSPLMKRSWDIDLLVRPQEVVAAAALLAELAYAPIMPPRPLDQEEFARWSVVSKEAELRSPTGSLLELHWRLSDHPMLLPALDATTTKRRVALLGEYHVATLADDANLAYLAVHGMAHAWFRLKWLADFNAFAAALPHRAETVARASRLGVGDALDTAFALANHLFHQGAKPTTELGRIAMVALATDDVKEMEAASSRARWRLSPGVAYRSAELRLRLRGSVDRLDHPLPPRLQFFYPLLRVPFFLHRKLIRTDRS